MLPVVARCDQLLMLTHKDYFDSLRIKSEMCQIPSLYFAWNPKNKPPPNSPPQVYLGPDLVIYKGHREIGLVLAGHYFLEENLDLAFKSEPNGNIPLDSLLFHCKFTGQVAVLRTQTL